MTKVNKKELWEKTKEPLRWLVLAIIPFAIAWLTEFDYQWALTITAILRIIDLKLHTDAPKGEAGGLVKF